MIIPDNNGIRLLSSGQKERAYGKLNRPKDVALYGPGGIHVLEKAWARIQPLFPFSPRT